MCSLFCFLQAWSHQLLLYLLFHPPHGTLWRPEWSWAAAALELSVLCMQLKYNPTPTPSSFFPFLNWFARKSWPSQTDRLKVHWGGGGRGREGGGGRLSHSLWPFFVSGGKLRVGAQWLLFPWQLCRRNLCPRHLKRSDFFEGKTFLIAATEISHKEKWASASTHILYHQGTFYFNCWSS